MYNYLINLNKICFYGMVLLALSACSQDAATPEAMPAIAEISAEELVDRIESNTAPLIIDVRSSDEFTAGHLPGALNIAHGEFVDAPDVTITLLPTAKDAEIIVHCVSGRRAGIAMEVMAAAGYTNLKHLSGDYSGWEAAGYPIESEELSPAE